jgi:hypothetical protein
MTARIWQNAGVMIAPIADALATDSPPAA